MLQANQVLQGRYRISTVLGQGGMGAVYAATDTRLQRECVVKQLVPLSNAPEHLAEASTQFFREASILANLNHPNLPRVSDYFEEQGSYYLVMDRVQGSDLGGLIGGGLPEATVLDYADQLLSVLEYIHGQGVLHRDIKPTNIIVQPDGKVFLVDFGLVKSLRGTQQVTVPYLRGVGTPMYAPPEQSGGGTDQRSDVYALGGTLYHALTGVAPASATGRITGTPLQPPRRIKPGISRTTEHAILKALALNPAERHQTAADFRAALFGGHVAGGGARGGARTAHAPTGTATGAASGAAVGDQRPTLVAAGPAPASALKPVRSRPADTWLIAGAALGAVVLFAVGAYVVWSLVHPPGPPPSPTGLAGTATPAAITPSPQDPTAAASAVASAVASETATVAPTDTPTPEPSPTQPPAPMDVTNVARVGRLALWTPGPVNQLVWSPSGDVLAGAGYIGTRVQLWSAADGSPVLDLVGHAAGVRSAAFSPDGKTLATGSDDATIRLWRVSDGKPLRTLTGHTKGVISVAFSPDGQTLASASDDWTVRLWRVADGKPLRVLTGHRAEVVTVAFSPDGTLVASGSRDNTARLWNAADGSLVRELQGHTGWVWSIAFSPDGSLLATGSTDDTIRLWHTQDGSLARELKGHTDYVLSVSFSPNGALLASGGKDGYVILWGVQDGTLLRKLRDGHTELVASVAFSPDGTRLASASADGTLCLWGTH